MGDARFSRDLSRKTTQMWREPAPRASADLWPSPERAADPWGSPGSAAGLGGEPSREGYAAWDAAPSSWIGWNTPSKVDVEDTILLETPEAPAEEADTDGRSGRDRAVRLAG